MADRPILFAGPMVRALLDGRKTQTRRVVKLPHNNPLGEWEPIAIGGPDGGRTAAGETLPLQGGIWHTRTGDSLMSPYGQPGDRLWVRETWMPGYEHEAEHEDGPKVTVLYRADMEERFIAAPSIELAEQWDDAYSEDGDPLPAWRPSIHMPRWASRILLELTSVRVERLQDISEEDTRAEGATPSIVGNDLDYLKYRAGYQTLWDSLNAARGYGWDVNPWVWVVDFRRLDSLA